MHFVTKREIKGTTVVPLDFVKEIIHIIFTEKNMVDKKEMELCVQEALKGNGNLFLVDVSVNKDNIVEVTIEASEGNVTIDDCVWLSGYIGERFDRDKEDYELTVTSAGLDMPFKVERQYLKAIGSEVEARLKGGRKIIGKLLGADNEGIEIEYDHLVQAEGQKKKTKETTREKIGFDTINSVQYHIIFEK